MHFVRTARAFSFLAMLLAVTVLCGGCSGKAPVKEQPDSPVWSVEISPVEDTNPTRTQHTFVVTVYDRDGRPVPNVQVHWILARTGDAVGDIVAFDDQDLGVGSAKALTTKNDNQYSVSYTNERSQVLDRGNRWVADEARWTNFEVGVGQTWCTITSPVEGDSHMIAYVPVIEDGLRHKVFALKHWQRVPHLVITKECADRVHVGTEFDYNFTVGNDGDGATPGDTIVMDSMPDGIQIMDGTTFPKNLGVLEPGQVESFSMRVRADNHGMKMNRVEARAGEFIARAECVTEVYGSGIEVLKDCGDVYELGEVVTFNIRVTNTEGAGLADVVLTDPLPTSIEYIDGTATVGNVVVSEGVLTWDGFGLAPGASADLTFTGRSIELGSHNNVAAAIAQVVGTDFTVDDEDECTFQVIGKPLLTIKMECVASNPLLVDDITVLNRMDNAKHIITVQNTGEVVAADVVVVDTIPLGADGDENIRYLGSNPAGVYDAGSHTITWNLGSMQPNETVVIEVEFQGVDVGPANSTATVVATDFPAGASDACHLYILGSPAFQEATIDVLDGQPDADNFKVGQEYYYVTIVQNEGEADLKIDMVVTLSQELEMVGNTVGFIPSLTSTSAPTETLPITALGGNKFQVESFNLAPGEQKWIRINVVGRQVTAVDAAEINIDLNWQLWYDGRLFPKKGKVVSSETTNIDPN